MISKDINFLANTITAVAQHQKSGLYVIAGKYDQGFADEFSVDAITTVIQQNTDYVDLKDWVLLTPQSFLNVLVKSIVNQNPISCILGSAAHSSWEYNLANTQGVITELLIPYFKSLPNPWSDWTEREFGDLGFRES